jgi:hypothetical protein
VFGAGARDFAQAQRGYLREYRRLIGGGMPARVAVGRVTVPFDSADRGTRQRYQAYARSRHGRTLAPRGERGTLRRPPRSSWCRAGQRTGTWASTRVRAPGILVPGCLA